MAGKSKARDDANQPVKVPAGRRRKAKKRKISTGRASLGVRPAKHPRGNTAGNTKLNPGAGRTRTHPNIENLRPHPENLRPHPENLVHNGRKKGSRNKITGTKKARASTVFKVKVKGKTYYMYREQHEEYIRKKAKGMTEKERAAFVHRHTSAVMRKRASSLVRKSVPSFFREIIDDPEMERRWNEVIGDLTDREVLNLSKMIFSKFRLALQWYYDEETHSWKTRTVIAPADAVDDDGYVDEYFDPTSVAHQDELRAMFDDILKTAEAWKAAKNGTPL